MASPASLVHSISWLGTPFSNFRKDSKKLPLSPAKEGHVSAGLPATQQSAKGYNQYIAQRMLLTAAPPRIGETVKHIPYFPLHAFLHPIVSVVPPISRHHSPILIILLQLMGLPW